MRKKVFFVLLFITLLFIIYFLLRTMQTMSLSKKNLPGEPATTPPPPTYKTIEYSDKTYAYEMALVPPGREIIISYNSRQESGYLLSTTLSCTYAINGGFYDTSGAPLGLLVESGSQKSPSIQSALFNGYFWIDSDNNSYIGSSVPDSPSHAVQSGPLLIAEGQMIPLEIRLDTPERRMAIAKTDTNEVLLFSLFDPSSLFVGPYLADVPSILTKIAKAESRVLTAALNLDGGTASFFKNSEKTLAEFKTIGSIICIR